MNEIYCAITEKLVDRDGYLFYEIENAKLFVHEKDIPDNKSIIIKPISKSSDNNEYYILYERMMYDCFVHIKYNEIDKQKNIDDKALNLKIISICSNLDDLFIKIRKHMENKERIYNLGTIDLPQFNEFINNFNDNKNDDVFAHGNPYIVNCSSVFRYGQHLLVYKFYDFNF